MITLAEVKASPRIPEEVPVKDFELAVSELIQTYRHRYDQALAVKALRDQADLVEEDEGWMAAPGKKGDDEEADQDDEEKEAETEEETGPQKDGEKEPGSGEPAPEEEERPGAA